MKRTSLAWTLGGIGVLAVGVITVLLGWAIMPARATAATIGTIVPWFITWGMILGTAVIAVIIAVNLFATGRGSGQTHASSGSRRS
jgi:hypothetical protein